MIFTPWEPTLAEAIGNVSVAALACFAFLAGLLWLGRWVVSLFEADSRDDGEGEP